MADIVHDFIIKAPRHDVFRAITMPDGLDAWWTKTSKGIPKEGATYELGFGPGYDWSAVVSRYVSDSEFELQLTSAHEDWQGTHVGFRLEAGSPTRVRFSHTGWREANDHYRTSCYCWAMYLRILKRNVEHGEVVPYDDRLDV
jgi:uncharacterized protein YndB with AHSA1/START domain